MGRRRFGALLLGGAAACAVAWRRARPAPIRGFRFKAVRRLDPAEYGKPGRWLG